MKPSAGHKPEPNTLQLIFYAAVSAGLILAPNAAAILSLPIAILLCNRPDEMSVLGQCCATT